MRQNYAVDQLRIGNPVYTTGNFVKTALTGDFGV